MHGVLIVKSNANQTLRWRRRLVDSRDLSSRVTLKYPLNNVYNNNYYRHAFSTQNPKQNDKRDEDRE